MGSNVQFPPIYEDWGAPKAKRSLLDIIRGKPSGITPDEDEEQPGPPPGIVGNDLPEQGGFSGDLRPKLSERVRQPTLMRSGETAPNVQPADSDWTPIGGRTAGKSRQPLGWKGKLLRIGEAALPIALGAVVGGGEGAAATAAGVMGGYGQGVAERRLQQQRLDEQANEHQMTLQERMMSNRAAQPMRDAQTNYYNARADALKQPVEAEPPKTQILEGPDGMPHVFGWNPRTSKFDTDMGKHFIPDQKTAAGDEFERLFSADPKNTGKKPTLQDKIAYEQAAHPREPREPRQPNEYADWKTQNPGGKVQDYLADRAGAAPTSSTRTMLEAAPRVEAFVDRIEPMINQIGSKLGPAAGRWSEFWQGKVGAGSSKDDQIYTALRTDVGLLQTLLMRMHVGARGGEYIMQHFQDIVNQGKQSPEMMKAALGEIRWYAQELRKEGQAGGGVRQGRPAAQPQGAPQAPQGKWNIHTGRYE